jgi:hypothetical protein
MGHLRESSRGERTSAGNRSFRFPSVAEGGKGAFGRPVNLSGRKHVAFAAMPVIGFSDQHNRIFPFPSEVPGRVNLLPSSRSSAAA